MKKTYGQRVIEQIAALRIHEALSAGERLIAIKNHCMYQRIEDEQKEQRKLINRIKRWIGSKFK